MKKVTVGRTEPVAYVTKGKHRLKQYNNDTVYLRNGDEFELELFNPTTDKVMAKIYLNGNSLGSGIVLRPGERVFIERYLDEAKKFMFQTYDVDGKSEEVKRAIANNGDVRVSFYKETINFNFPVNNTIWTTNWPTWYGGTYSTPTFGGPSTGNLLTGNLNSNSVSSHSVMYSANSLNDDPPAQACMDSLSFMGSKQKRLAPTNMKNENVETGRIDKGSVSDQSFGTDYSTFNTYWTWETKWKILPLSQKPLVSADIKVFCTNCGTRQKKSSHRFCPNCGTKF